MRISCFYKNDFGLFRIEEEDGTVCGMKTTDEEMVRKSPQSELMKQVFLQLDEYFAGKRRQFTFPFRCQGTEFQQKVWRKLMRIPYGETRTYGQVAAAVSCLSGARAVGMACHCNPLMIVIPCHRVTGGGGRLTGYAGGLELKRKLLDLEIRAGLI